MPATDLSPIVELRQYTLHPQQRDVLIDLFDSEFIEPQEAHGMRVLGQFRDLDQPDLFVWLRGFADMDSRRRALEAFYGGPVWAAHHHAANATMIDSDNVLLLRPAWPGAASALPHHARPEPGATDTVGGVLDATVFYLHEPATPALLDFCRHRMAPTLQRGGAHATAWYCTEASANTFPRLPVRTGEHVLLGLALFGDAAALQAFADSGAWAREVAPALAHWLARAPETHRLQPTARSALHA
ncbi:NIPSNAP family protein [Acidovorax sp. D2M1]|uniref:NIPSNAP family protein n=1 Tax=Acidovorax benzenivorans TaxID=2987520 RepID=A0ABT5RRP1_9BURK|nr:NIPSNAP family protein [Acidovorax benzenivorans]MDD2176367.1 NIPSNAP family protein [Acidovorax benzenivorans]